MVEKLGPNDPSNIGPYTIIGRLGKGAMGWVYLGRSPEGRLVAVKVMRDHENPLISRERFRHEVNAAKLVKSLHTAQILDSDPEADSPWYASQYVPGPTLTAAVKIGGGGLPYRSIDVLARGLYRALSEIHRMKIVHRDLKPDNVVISENGPIVIDFGVAHLEDRTQLTQKGFAVGTLQYACPEQIRNIGRPQAAWDVFAFGGVLVYALTGRPPFQRSSPVATMHAIVNDHPPQLEAYPQYLRDLILPCLNKDPEERPGLAAIRDLLPGDPMEEVQGTDWLPTAVEKTVLAETKRFPVSESKPVSPRPPQRPSRSRTRPTRPAQSRPRPDTTGPVPTPPRPAPKPAGGATSPQGVWRPEPPVQTSPPSPAPVPKPAPKPAPTRVPASQPQSDLPNSKDHSLKGFWIFTTVVLLVGALAGGSAVWFGRPGMEKAYNQLKEHGPKLDQKPTPAPGATSPTAKPSPRPSVLPPKPSFAAGKLGKTYVRSTPQASITATRVTVRGYDLVVSVTVTGYGKNTDAALKGACLVIKPNSPGSSYTLTPGLAEWDELTSTSTTNRKGSLEFHLHMPGTYTLVPSCKDSAKSVGAALGRNTLKYPGHLDVADKIYDVAHIQRTGKDVLVIMPKFRNLQVTSMCVRTPQGALVRHSALKAENVEGTGFYYATYSNVVKGAKLYVSCSVNSAKKPVFNGTSLTLP